jgi:hypothetical protein
VSRIDWDFFEKSIRGEVEAAARKTNEQLDTEISSLTRLTEEEVERLFPTRADKAKLARLMGIVRGAENRNRKARRLVDEAEDLAGTVIRLLEALV